MEDPDVAAEASASNNGPQTALPIAGTERASESEREPIMTGRPVPMGPPDGYTAGGCTTRERWLAMALGVFVVGFVAALGALVQLSAAAAGAGGGSAEVRAESGSEPAPAGRSETNLHALWQRSLRDAKHIDLTHAFSPSIPVWEAFGPLGVSAGKAGVEVPGFVEEGEEFSYSRHGFVTTAYSLVRAWARRV